MKMKWMVRFTVKGPDKKDEKGLIAMIELLNGLGKCKHFSFTGWTPRRGG